jgi:8-oxo-dGTP pyrophosphatase MutT (NUDIX family)
MTSAESTPRPPVKVFPAATILLVRDSDDGIEAFMVKRHHKIDFMSGALVFPGGKLAPGDSDPRIRSLTDGADHLDDIELAMAACAIREAFEESGILLARMAGAQRLLSADEVEPLSRFREPLNAETLPLADFLEQNGLKLAVDKLVRYAHWITPEMVPKRFDTLFFIAAAPEGQIGAHDGYESEDSGWVTPHGAVSEPERWSVVFPTRMNLQMLAESKTVADALSAAAARKIVPVLPWVEKRDGEPFLRLPPDAGYGDVYEPMTSVRS